MAEDDEEGADGASTETAQAVFTRACDLAEAQNWAEALPLFHQAVAMPDMTQRGYDSCMANIGMCAHHLGDHTTALTYLAMFLDSSAPAAADGQQRVGLLEMFLASYKGQAGIIFQNPYNEYG